jgi:cell division septation protein DedD
MRTLALLLLMLDLALLGWLRGMFGTAPSSGREPGRLEQQMAADRIRVLTDHDVQQLRHRAADAGTAASAPPTASSTASATASAIAASEAGSCVEVGDFAGDGALVRFRDRLSDFKLNEKTVEQAQESPGWYAVTMAGLKARADAERRAEELRQQGERDVLIVQAGNPNHFSLALGAFRDREQARRMLARLERRGIKGAHLADNAVVMQTTRVRVRGIDAQTAAQLEALLRDFPQQKLQACAADPAPRREPGVPG